MNKSILAALALSSVICPPSKAAAPTSDKELFNLNKVWSAQLVFTEDQWKAIEPKRTGGGFGGFGGFGGGGRPQGGGRGPGGPGGFNPGAMVSGGLVRELDADKDGSLSKAEFVDGFAGWFKTWDTNQTGSLTSQQLTDGLNTSLNPLGGGGGQGGRPGGGGYSLTARE